MKTIETAIDTVNKFGDTSTIFKLDLKDDNEYVPLDDKNVVLNVANDTGLVLTTPMTTFSGHTVMVDFSSQGLAELTPDSYNLEIEVTYSDGDISKFPTKGGLKFNITNNLKETTGALVPTVTFDNVLDAVDEKIAVYMDTVKVGPAGPVGPAGNVDTSHDNTFTGVNKFTQLIDGAFQTRKATFTDFAAVATNMKVYAGNWIVERDNITNSPEGVSTSYIVTVIPGTWGQNGTIYISDYTSDNFFYTNVDGGIKGWRKVASDNFVVHNTGTETVAGDKTFTGSTTFTQPINGMFTTKNIEETDYSNVAKNMYKYSGIGLISGVPLENSPIDGATWYLIQIMPGGSTDSGYIQAYFRGKTYGTGVNQGKIQGWTESSDDSTVVHNTGDETVAGDKTFTGNTNFSGKTTLKTGNYGLRVTTTGIQKTSDNGVTWTNI